MDEQQQKTIHSGTGRYWVVLVVVVLGAIIPSFAHQAPQLSADDLENIEMERHQGPAASADCNVLNRIRNSDKQITDEKGNKMNRYRDRDTMMQ